MKERRGRANPTSGAKRGRPPKLDKNVEEDLIAENQRLRMEIEYLKKLSALVLAEERQNAEIISELRQRYPLKDLLQLSGMARSTFYYYLKYPTKSKYECEKQEIADIFNAHKSRYGYRIRRYFVFMYFIDSVDL